MLFDEAKFEALFNDAFDRFMDLNAKEVSQHEISKVTDNFAW